MARMQNQDAIDVSSTEAQNRFGHYLEQAARDRAVVITRRGQPQAVLVSFERYQAMKDREPPALDRLRRRFDEVFDRMQTPAFRAASKSFYSVASEEMGRAAVEAARTEGTGDS
jgi:prevent-host-death family protein